MPDPSSNVEFKIEVTKPANYVYFEGEEIEGQVIATVTGLFFSKSISILMEGQCHISLDGPNSELYVQYLGLIITNGTKVLVKYF